MTLTEAWREVIVSINTTVQDVIMRLDRTGLQIIMVLNADGKLVGTITDGDIRRGLLKGYGMDSMIEPLVHRDALVVPPLIEHEIVKQIMQANKIHQIPVVDAERQVVGLYTWDDLIENPVRDHTMVIMAGGLGTRLRPHTEKCPKPLLPVAGKPMLEHIITQAKGGGFNRFIISTHYLGHMIEEHFGNGEQWGVSIEYINEKSPLGTAGALGYLKDKLSSPFVVTNGDVLTDIKYSELLEFHALHNSEATIAVRLHEWQHPFGVVEIDGLEITGFEEKPIARLHVNAGVYVLNPCVLELLEENQQCDMPTLFERVKANKQRLVAYPMHEPWLDVGRPDDLEKARSDRD